MNQFVRRLFSGMSGDAMQRGSRIAAHMPTLYLLAKIQSPLPIVECGVGRGWSTISLLAGIGNSGSLHSYDIYQDTQRWTILNMGLTEPPPQWKFTLKDSVEAAKDWPDSSVGLWFLDTNHVLENTRNELASWYPKMHRNGIMCGHDYYIDRRYDNLNVRKAVDEFAANHNHFKLQVIDYDDGFFILWPKSMTCSV